MSWENRLLLPGNSLLRRAGSERCCAEPVPRGSVAKPLVHFQRTSQTNGHAVTLHLKKKRDSVSEKKEFPLAS